MLDVKKYWAGLWRYLNGNVEIDRLTHFLLIFATFNSVVSSIATSCNPPQKICADKGGVYSAGEKICIVTKDK